MAEQVAVDHGGVRNGRFKGRKCAVCGRRTSAPTYGFGSILVRNGIRGDKPTLLVSPNSE